MATLKRRRGVFLRSATREWERLNFFRFKQIEAGHAIFVRVFVQDRAGRRGVLNWQFNGWAKYSEREI